MSKDKKCKGCDQPIKKGDHCQKCKEFVEKIRGIGFGKVPGGTR